MRTLQTAEISKSYRGRKVVDNVSLWVKQGEAVGLAGAERGGQDHIVLYGRGLISPDSGSVLVCNGDGMKISPPCRCISGRSAASAICRRKPRFSASSPWKII